MAVVHRVLPMLGMSHYYPASQALADSPSLTSSAPMSPASSLHAGISTHLPTVAVPAEILSAGRSGSGSGSGWESDGSSWSRAPIAKHKTKRRKNSAVSYVETVDAADNEASEASGDSTDALASPSHGSGCKRQRSTAASKHKPKQNACQHVIDVGYVIDSGERIYHIESPWFGGQVEVYTAVGDTHRRLLFRASALANKFGCQTNLVGMYLQRRRHNADGLYQAIGFTSKPNGRTGLKAGGYFLSMDVCEGFEQHYQRQAIKREDSKAVASRAAVASTCNLLKSNSVKPITVTPATKKEPVESSATNFSCANLETHINNVASAPAIRQVPTQDPTASSSRFAAYSSLQCTPPSYLDAQASDYRAGFGAVTNVNSTQNVLPARYQQPIYQQLVRSQLRQYPADISPKLSHVNAPQERETTDMHFGNGSNFAHLPLGSPSLTHLSYGGPPSFDLNSGPAIDQLARQPLMQPQHLPLSGFSEFVDAQSSLVQDARMPALSPSPLTNIDSDSLFSVHGEKHHRGAHAYSHNPRRLLETQIYHATSGNADMYSQAGDAWNGDARLGYSGSPFPLMSNGGSQGYEDKTDDSRHLGLRAIHEILNSQSTFVHGLTIEQLQIIQSSVRDTLRQQQNRSTTLQASV